MGCSLIVQELVTLDLQMDERHDGSQSTVKSKEKQCILCFSMEEKNLSNPSNQREIIGQLTLNLIIQSDWLK